jgi:hypothetical protein
LAANTTGEGNVAVGRNALTANTSASNNVAVGQDALAACTTGHSNTAIGQDALGDATTAEYNVAIGRNALNASVSSGSNVAIGYDALGKVEATAGANVAVGYAAMEDAVDGSYFNACVGYAAGKDLTTGDYNVLIGYNAGAAASPSGTITTENGIVCIGDDNVSASHVEVDWSIGSDERDKADITALDLGLDFVNDLNPVTYRWDKRSRYLSGGSDDLSSVTPDGTHKEDQLDLGFKAQEVEALELAAGYSVASKTNLTTTVGGGGEKYSLKYSKFVPILVKAVQELSAEIDKLKA